MDGSTTEKVGIELRVPVGYSDELQDLKEFLEQWVIDHKLDVGVQEGSERAPGVAPGRQPQQDPVTFVILVLSAPAVVAFAKGMSAAFKAYVDAHKPRIKVQLSKDVKVDLENPQEIGNLEEILTTVAKAAKAVKK